MAGHNKWSKIKRQKASSDKKRSNLFGKLAKAITLAARSGGGDPEMNYQLRLAVDKAKAENMPKDNIERAIKRGTGEEGGAQLEQAEYEIYGPEGVAIMAQALTDNKNRTSSEIKAIVNKMDAKLANPGAVSYLFDTRGVIYTNLDGQNREDIEMKIIESGAEDYEFSEDQIEIYTDLKDLESVSEKLEKSGLKIDDKEIILDAREKIEVSDDSSSRIVKLLEALDDLEDIISVTSNLG